MILYGVFEENWKWKERKCRWNTFNFPICFLLPLRTIAAEEDYNPSFGKIVNSGMSITN